MDSKMKTKRKKKMFKGITGTLVKIPPPRIFRRILTTAEIAWLFKKGKYTFTKE